MRFRQKLTKRRPLRLMMICRRWLAVRCPARLNVVRSLLDEDETFLEITTFKFKSMFHTELQEVVLEQGERGRHISGAGTIFDTFSIGHRVCLELACKTNRLEVFHLFAPGCCFKNIEAPCVHVSCWVTVLRVVCSSAHHVCLRYVLVISR